MLYKINFISLVPNKQAFLYKYLIPLLIFSIAAKPIEDPERSCSRVAPKYLTLEFAYKQHHYILHSRRKLFLISSWYQIVYSQSSLDVKTAYFLPATLLQILIQYLIILQCQEHPFN